MRHWRSISGNRRGHSFAQEVVEKVRNHGWRVEEEVTITKILGKSFDRDYGDVDALAWNEKSGRVLEIECKSLIFGKTPKEIVQQLNKYRGVNKRNGKVDELKKHIDRCDLLRDHASEVGKYLNFTEPMKMEGWVCFRHPVPMLFAWKNLGTSVRFTTFDNLDKLSNDPIS